MSSDAAAAENPETNATFLPRNQGGESTRKRGYVVSDLNTRRVCKLTVPTTQWKEEEFKAGNANSISICADKVHSADESPEMTAARKQCLMIAKYVPRGLDAFCDLNEVFQVCLLMDRVMANPDNETLQAAAQKILGKMYVYLCC